MTKRVQNHQLPWLSWVEQLPSKGFDNYDDAYDLLEEIYGDMCCSDADYEDRPYYEIVELKE